MRLYGSDSVEQGSSITTDAAGNLYLAGHTMGNLSGHIFAGGTYDAYVSKLDAAGNVKWTRVFGSAALDLGWAVTTDAGGNVYLAGGTAGNLSDQTNSGGWDAFVSKLDDAGNVQWTRLLGSAADDRGTAMASDAAGNIYLAGYTSGSFLSDQINSGSSDAFVSKLDDNGNVQWTRLLGSAADDRAFAITADSGGSIYLAGVTEGDLQNLTNLGGSDAFVSALDDSGNIQWTRLLGSAADDYGSALTTDVRGNIYLSGNTYGNLSDQTNSGTSDAFVSMIELTPFVN